MKICIVVSEMSQLQWHLREGNIKQRSFVVDIPKESLPQGLQEFFKTREDDLMFRKFSNLDSITIVEE